MISVLIADDSFLMRTLIGDILKSDPEITVVGAVGDGEQVIEAARRLKPDVITMDLEMPKIDGLTATRRIMEDSRPSPIVVMVSAFSKEKAGSMLECLSSGAFDCVKKPSGTISLDLETVAAELIKKVKAAARARTDVLKKTTGHATARHAARSEDGHASNGKTVIVIGASTGGPPVLETLLSALPEPLAALILIAQHMPEPFTSSLAERLDRVSPMPVAMAADGTEVVSGGIILARGDSDMRLAKDAKGKLHARLTAATTKPGLYPSIDALMESAADTYGKNVIGVLMTGMGSDGTAGMRAIKAHGGRTIVQDPATCVIDSMVRSVIDDGNADEQLSPRAIAERLHALTLS